MDEKKTQQITYVQYSDTTNFVASQSQVSSSTVKSFVNDESKHSIRTETNRGLSPTCQEGNALDLSCHPQLGSAPTTFEHPGNHGGSTCSSREVESNNLLRRATPVKCKTDEGYQESSDNFETAVSDQPLSPCPFNAVEYVKTDKDPFAKSSDGLSRGDAPRKRRISKEDLWRRSSRYLERRKATIAKTAPVNQAIENSLRHFRTMMELYAINLETMREETARLYDAHKTEFEPGIDVCSNGKCCLHSTFHGADQESEPAKSVGNFSSDTRNESSDQIASSSDFDSDVSEAEDLGTDLPRSKQRRMDRISTDTTCTLRPSQTPSQSGDGDIPSANSGPELIEYKPCPKTLNSGSVLPDESSMIELKPELLSKRSDAATYTTENLELQPIAQNHQTILPVPPFVVLQVQPNTSSNQSVIPPSESVKIEPRPRAVHERSAIAAPESRQRNPHRIDSLESLHRYQHGILEECPDPNWRIDAQQSHSAYNAVSRHNLKRKASAMQPTTNTSRHGSRNAMASIPMNYNRPHDKTMRPDSSVAVARNGIFHAALRLWSKTFGARNPDPEASHEVLSLSAANRDTARDFHPSDIPSANRPAEFKRLGSPVDAVMRHVMRGQPAASQYSPRAYPSSQLMGNAGSNHLSHSINFISNKVTVETPRDARNSIRYALHPDARQENKIPPMCSNCMTRGTPAWRRNATTGLYECNACNAYFKNRQERRPPYLWKKPIHKRMRNKKTRG